MARKKARPEDIVEKLVELEPVEFLGICHILNVDLFIDEEDKEPKDFEDMWSEVCDKVWALNRVQRRNLMKLVRAATKSGE